MKERDYIDASNLARLRLARQAIVDSRDNDDREAQIRKELLTWLAAWLDIIEQRIVRP